jgi:outer membrane protein TolC
MKKHLDQKLIGKTLGGKTLFVALTFAGLGAGAVPAHAEDLPAPTPQVPTVGVPTPQVPTAGELPTTSTQQSDLPLLSFEEAIAMARKNNRSIKVDRAALVAAQTQTETAWSALLPVIAAQGKFTRNYTKVEFPAGAFGPTPFLLQPLNQWDASISGTTPLLAPAAWAGLKSVKASVASSEANFAAQEAELLVTAGQAFLAAAGTDELVEARRSSVVVAQATLKDAQVRLSAGSVTKVDVDRAQVTVVRTEQQEREAVTARDRSYRTLGTLLQSNKPFKVDTNFPASAMPNPNDVQTALHLRPEFRALEETAKSADQEANARAWLWAPVLSAFGNARVFNYDNFHLDRHSWAAGAQLDWQLFDGGARDAARHQANARAAQAREQAAVFADQVRDDLANSSSDLRTKQQGVEAAQRAVTLSNESLELIRTQYSAGTATQLDLLEAQDALIAANVALVQARFDVASADLTLRYSAGTFPPKQ